MLLIFGGCVEIEGDSFIPFRCDGRLSLGSVPRPKPPGFPSKIRLPNVANTIQIPVPR